MCRLFLGLLKLCCCHKRRCHSDIKACKLDAGTSCLHVPGSVIHVRYRCGRQLLLRCILASINAVNTHLPGAPDHSQRPKHGSFVAARQAATAAPATCTAAARICCWSSACSARSLRSCWSSPCLAACIRQQFRTWT